MESVQLSKCVIFLWIPNPLILKLRMYNINKISAEEDSEDNSDDNLKIVIESPNSKRKTPPKPTESEKLIIESIEDELQRRLEEKAAKTKLNAIHVKNIIKHVVTNEHVLALVKKAENPTGCNESIPYEPKLTRAKAKELLSSVAIAPMPWTTSKPTSEVQALFTEELQEDSSGDEYIPGEEESEDDRDSSIISDPPSVPPPTPPTPSANIDSYTQTNWTDDGVFKIPPNKSKEEVEEEANIARRTRSKLCLSSTPLEVIEEAFIPPDITTDMYDMHCDNDDWMDFLKKFTRPLDEVAKATEDEEQDPEYNILADEEIDKIDKEELRVDKAVKVTRKELNDLIAELLECSEICNLPEMEKKAKNSNFDCNGNDQSEAPNYSERSKSIDNRKEEVLPNERVTVCNFNLILKNTVATFFVHTIILK
uniref:GON-4-like protein n=1 Tax=Anoplophora glabripennis TaxID=217634 RepID=V5GD07_ANOGL